MYVYRLTWNHCHGNFDPNHKAENAEVLITLGLLESFPELVLQVYMILATGYISEYGSLYTLGWKFDYICFVCLINPSTFTCPATMVGSKQPFFMYLSFCYFLANSISPCQTLLCIIIYNCIVCILMSYYICLYHFQIISSCLVFPLASFHLSRPPPSVNSNLSTTPNSTRPWARGSSTSLSTSYCR